MRVLSIISFAIAAAIFTYLIGATLGSPVGQVFDEVTTVVADFQRDDPTTQAVFSDEPVTEESATQRARQDGEDDNDEDDDATTVAAVSSTKAPIPPPLRNESTILTEFNFVSQPVPAKPVVPATVDEQDTATQAPAQEQGEDNDSENEISQDEAGTTVKSASFVSEYQYTVENFNKAKKRV